ncbi:MAG: recombinase family protein [Desulfurococcaceae archaeon]
MIRGLGYVRVSREDENPENQILSIKEWAQKNNVEILGFYIDVDVSGSIKPRERPQYNAMLQAAKSLGINLLIFYDLSRLSRSLEDGLEELKRLTEEGFMFKFVAQEFLDYISDPLLRKKVISDFLWFAELYREDVRRRTKAGLERVRREGKKLGRPSYPFPVDEIKQLMKKRLPLTKIHKLLIVEKKICREVKGKGEDCMKYETFRKKVKHI